MEAHDVGRYRSDLDWDSRAPVVLSGQLDSVVTPANATDTGDRPRVAGEKIAGRARRFGRYQPRWIHSSRCGRSRPMVVGLPWPGRTWVSSERVNSLPRMLSMMVGKLA